MFSTFIRAFAIMLALTGFSATSYTGSNGNSGAHSMMDGGPTTSSPTPVCPPNDPNMCGLH